VKFWEGIKQVFKPACKNCGSKSWGRAMFKGRQRRPIYCDTCPGEDGENFRGLDRTMNEMDKLAGNG